MVLEDIARILKLNKSDAPRRPPRIMLMGPPGCGKTAQAKHIAHKFKLAYIKVNHLIKDTIRREGNSQKGKDLKQRLATSAASKLHLPNT